MKYIVASANSYGNAGDDICSISCKQIIKSVDKRAKVIFTQPPFNKRVLERGDVIVLGGGGIIYDANSENLDNYLKYMEYGQAHFLPTIGLGLGEQGIVTKEGIARYTKVFNNAKLLTVRSKLDKQRLQEIGVHKANVTQDLAFSYDYHSFRQLAKVNKKLRAKKAKQHLGIVISDQMHMIKDTPTVFSMSEKKNALHFKNTLLSTIGEITKNYHVTIIVQSRDDLELAKEYAKNARVKMYRYFVPGNLSKLLRVYAKQDIVIAQRFHGLIFGLALGIKVIPLGYQGKKQFKLLNDLKLSDKLVMYHQTKRIEQLLKGLTSGQIDNQFVIQSDDRVLSLIQTSAGRNQELLAKVLKS